MKNTPTSPSVNVVEALSTLEKTIQSVSTLYQQVQTGMAWAEPLCKPLEPCNWTDKIEASATNQPELDRMSVVYNELALTALSARLSLQWLENQLKDQSQTLRLQIGIARKAHEGTRDSAEPWQKQQLQRRCLEAVDLLKLVDKQAPLANNHFLDYHFFDQACLEVASLIRVTSALEAYPTEMVVAGHDYDLNLKPDVDLRGVTKIRFIANDRFLLPYQRQLAELLDKADEAMHEARTAEHRLKYTQMFERNPREHIINNGNVNENQHAMRMVELMRYKKDGPRGEKIAAQTTDQNERRRLYEETRLDLRRAIHGMKWLVCALNQTLREALATSGDLDQSLKPGEAPKTPEYYLLHSLFKNNVLVADLRLRTLGRELLRLQETYERDLSRGAGKKRLQALFLEVTEPFAK